MQTETCCSGCALAGRRDHDRDACARRRAQVQTGPKVADRAELPHEHEAESAWVTTTASKPLGTV